MSVLYCGAASRDITPPEELLPGLRGLMGCRYGGVHDPLKVRAIAFSNGTDRALIIQLDLDKDQAPTTQLPIISQRWNVPEENILYFGIHTHSAPMFSGRHELKLDADDVLPCTQAYEKLVFDAMYQAIDAAFATLRLARAGFGTVESYTNVRRVEDFYAFDDAMNVTVCASQGSDISGEVSHTMAIMQVNDLEDNPIAFLVNFPMHCVIMFLNRLAADGTNLISGDAAGNLSRMLEARFPGAVVAWSSGAAGDVNPLYNSFYSCVDPETGKVKEIFVTDRADKLLEYVVNRQYSDALRAIAGIEHFSTDGRIFGAVQWAVNPTYKYAVGADGRRTLTDEVDPEGFPIRLQLLRIGDTALVGVGGELFNSFAEELKTISPLKNTVVINHNCSLIKTVGYILDDNAIGRGYSLRPGAGCHILPGHIGPSLKKHFVNMLGMM